MHTLVWISLSLLLIKCTIKEKNDKNIKMWDKIVISTAFKINGCVLIKLIWVI